MHNTCLELAKEDGRLLLILPHGIIKIWICHLVLPIQALSNSRTQCPLGYAQCFCLEDILTISYDEEYLFSVTKEPIVHEG